MENLTTQENNTTNKGTHKIAKAICLVCRLIMPILAILNTFMSFNCFIILAIYWVYGYSHSIASAEEEYSEYLTDEIFIFIFTILAQI